jgi:pyruvate-ferredoxin/flavodoxin oxidoreductase
LQSFKNGLESIEEVDLSQVPVTSGDSLGDKSAPVILQRLAARDDQFDSLPRFWNQTGILYREKQVDRIVSDPYLASGTIAPLSATFRDFAGKRTTIPQVDADKCTGCGRCWETCPDSSIAPLVISPSDLIDHGIREAGADSLRQLANQLNSRILSQARKQELAGDVGSILRETYDWLSGKMEQTPERQQAVEEALDLVCNKIGSLPVSVTQEFFDNAESNSKDSGEFLVLAINPDTCKDCGLCERVCDAEAITFAPQVDENINAARLVWDIWSAMPDTRSDTISRVIESPEFSNMAAINLSRYCLLSMAGGDGAESGSGEKVALRMILSATEFNQQPIVRRFIDQLADTSEEIVNEIRELLAISLPAEDLDLLSQGMDSIRAPLVELSELAKKVEASMDVTPVDAVRLNRLLEVASRLTDLHWRFSSGRQGLGRARFGMAMAPGTVAGWAASFPYNVFQSPVVLDFANETPQMAAGLLEGHLRDTCESVALLRAARLEIEQPAGLQFALDSLSHLKWQDLTEEERQICPPMLVIGDDNTFGGEALAQVLWALGSDLPVKIVAFSDLDISGSQGTKDSQTNMAMLAITGRTSFVTQTSIADAGHMYSSITQAIQHLGPALVRIHGASPSRHGFGSSQTIEAAYQAVRSRTFPLFTYNPGAEGVHGMRLDLTGNESLAGIWGDDEQPYTPAHWAATEQRFSHHFKPMDEDEVNGVAVHEFIELNERARKGKIAFVSVPKGETETRLAVDDLVIDATELARDNWRVMQELAGIVTPFTGHVEEEVRKQVQAEHDAEIASIREEYEQQISELDASIRSDVAGRVRSQLLRLVNSGSSNTE